MSYPQPPGGTNPPRPAAPVTGSSPRVPVGGAPRPQPDLATRLDGQRGWLNELDRSLKKRSIIALVLTCLAVGVASAALYVSITKNSDGDRITALEARIKVLEAAGVVTAPTTGIPETGVTDPSIVVPDTGVTGTTGDTVIPDTTVPAN